MFPCFFLENNHPQVPIMRRVWCYPIQFSTPCPRLPTVDFLQEREQALLRYHGDTQPINTTHLQKLVCVFVQYFLHLFHILLI